MVLFRSVQKVKYVAASLQGVEPPTKFGDDAVMVL